MLTIRTENVFSTIAEISETLSLTNDPDKLLHTSLDTLAEVLNIESGWVQTVDGQGSLTLISSRGFTTDMTGAVNGLKRTHPLVREVIGLGHKVVINNLTSSDMEGLDAFRKAGVRWLIAVPLMTYRVHGILGAASRYRRRLDKHTPDLIMVTGRLIATALAKTNLARVGMPPAAPSGGNGKKLVTVKEAADDLSKLLERKTEIPDMSHTTTADSVGKLEIKTDPVERRKKVTAGSRESRSAENRYSVAEAVLAKQTGTTQIIDSSLPEEVEDTTDIKVPEQEISLHHPEGRISIPDEITGVPLLPVDTMTCAEDDRTEIIEIEPELQPQAEPEEAILPPIQEPLKLNDDVPEESSPEELPPVTIYYSGNNGKKTKEALQDTVEQDDAFVLHSRRMSSFRAHHAPLH